MHYSIGEIVATWTPIVRGPPRFCEVCGISSYTPHADRPIYNNVPTNSRR